MLRIEKNVVLHLCTLDLCILGIQIINVMDGQEYLLKTANLNAKEMNYLLVAII